MILPVVTCVLVHGHVPYSPDYVHNLRAMVAKHLPMRHRFIVLTDQPDEFRGASDMETMRVPMPARDVFGWWSKLKLFSPAFDEMAVPGARCLYLDLDVLVVRDLSEVLFWPWPFVLAADGAPNFHGKGRRVTVKRYNSSVMAWNAGEQRGLWSMWSPAVAERLWGDQDWIGEQAPTAATYPLDWTPRLSALIGGNDPPYLAHSTKVPPLGDASRVVLCKKPKNAVAAARWPWFDQLWKGV